MKRKFPKTLLCLSVFFSALFCVEETAAQEIIGIQVNPPIIEVRAGPGEIVRETIHVTNLGGSDETLVLRARDVKGTTNAGQPIFAEIGEPTGFEMSSWITFPEKELLIERGITKHIPIEINVPESATPGGHFAGVFFTREAVTPEESGAGIGFGVGSVFTFRVSGDVREEASLRSFHAEKIVYQKAEVHFLAQVENEGNVLIRPRGLIEIRDMFGNDVAKISVNEREGAVFPHGNRIFKETWKKEKITMGRYRATVSLVYGEDGRKTISQATSFWVIPFRDIGVGAGILFALILGVGFGVRLYIQKKIREFQTLNEGVGGYHRKKTRSIEPTLLRREKSKKGFFRTLLKTSLAMFAVSFVIFLLLLLFA